MSYELKPCTCGHGQAVHRMDDLSTRRLTGRCHQGNYDRRGKWEGKGCPCLHYQPKEHDGLHRRD